MNRASRLLGSLPRIMPGVEDAAALLKPREMRKLKERVRELERRFPQVHVHVMVRNFSPEQPIELFAFWIFNGGQLAQEAHKGGENRDVLFIIDPVNHRMALMVGYGLEPFLRQQALDHLLATAAPHMREQRWLVGFLRVLDGLDLLLESAVVQSAEALGVKTAFDSAAVDCDY
jgi:uncharacterized membrane protein YgcG